DARPLCVASLRGGGGGGEAGIRPKMSATPVRKAGSGSPSRREGWGTRAPAPEPRATGIAPDNGGSCAETRTVRAAAATLRRGARRQRGAGDGCLGRDGRGDGPAAPGGGLVRRILPGLLYLLWRHEVSPLRQPSLGPFRAGGPQQMLIF